VDFNYKLTGWYLKNKRDLPWRLTNDPYTIWISEVILQQTRVDQGISYFNRFIKTFPDVQSLAGASEDEVLKLWQVLGFYSSARNLHKASKIIFDRFSGVIPAKFEEIISLPGIGESTASAIASFAYNMCYPVTDGNVIRFQSRMSCIPKREGERASS
jgi:A/G-specific adenine glycosylase